MDQMLATGLPQVVTLGGTALPLAGRARVNARGITPMTSPTWGMRRRSCGSTRWPACCTRTAPRRSCAATLTDVDDVLLAAAGRLRIAEDYYGGQAARVLGPLLGLW